MPNTSSVIRSWVLRILVPLNGINEFVDSRGYRHSEIARLLGLKEPDNFQYDFDARAAMNSIYKMYHQEEQTPHSIASLSPALNDNLQRLAELVDLSPLDCKILALAINLRNNQLLDDCANYLGNVPSAKVIRAVSVILAEPEKAVRKALNGRGILVQSGLIRRSYRGLCNLRDQLDLLSDNFADLMTVEGMEPLNLLSDTVAKAAPAKLIVDDFQHIAKDLTILQPYLNQVAKHKKRGVNIYLHGVPGTGKTQLARVLAKELGCDLFEISNEDECGDPVSGYRRLRSYRAAQSLLARREVIIAFDEVEDIFNIGGGLFARPSVAQENKAWINRMLEENPVPTIWISNSLGLDPAFVRRFDMVIELNVPPEKKRNEIISHLCGDLAGEGLRRKLASAEHLAPAIIATASSLTRDVQPFIENTEEVLEHLISNTLQAQGHQPLSQSANLLPEFYQPQWVNADCDLLDLAEGIEAIQSARICFYGPPGTGKTAYVHWLAKQLGKQLLIRKASDLLSRYVGGSEKNIAQAFKQAENEQAILLIDEIDSLLFDRRTAIQSWQLSQVNELLTAMENFSGIFIASSNLIDTLDQASLRRFDLKVNFNYLAFEQAQQLLTQYVQLLALEQATELELKRLKRLDVLTPGDFSAVTRRSRFSPIKNTSAFVQALEAECQLKESSNSKVS